MLHDETLPSREWWAQRWIDVLESFGFRQRLARARTYVREGHVLNLDFQGSNVTAQVRGTAPDPYQVKLKLDPFTDEQWEFVIDSMADRAIFSAKLLAGEMPQNIEEVFISNGLSLFPFSKFDIHSHCNCPDPVNPCKHIGAVYYLLGDRFSEDPFVLFQLRGRTKDSILEALRQRRQTESSPTPTPEPAAEPWSIAQFWHYTEQLDPSLVVIAPSSGETLLDILGEIPFPQDQISTEQRQALLAHLKDLYAQVGQAAVMQAMTTP
ncbi:metal-binding protein [Alkalinema sp. FACHB-956]|uniref:SWIM zinc finger family protein n=1 Tax=Alkalinema sp. FACHB-956 TaxID=2692768 RepID=UPI001688B4A7|nr:metal-binding protein [Alkalinema sp. FACHB-956]MBD2328136.1 metal-binding protein [Alkalinema sp. FACHB-956]